MLVRYLAASVYNLVGQPGATIDRLPITGFLHSGVSASDSHSWTTPGTYTISADAVNASFATSAPSTLTVTMSNPPAKPTLTSCSNSPTAPLTWRGGSITSTVSPASGGSGSPYQYQWSTGTGFGNWYSSNSTTTTFAQNLASTSVTYRISVQTRDSTSTVSNPLICGDVVVSGTTTNPVNPPGGSAIDLKAHKTATDAGSENPAPFKVGDSILMSWTGLTALNLDPSSRCIMNLAPTDGKVMPVMNLSANFSGFSSDVTVPAKLIPDTGNTYLPAGSYVANIACAPQYHASIFDLFRRALANPVTATSNIVPIKVLRSSIQEF